MANDRRPGDEHLWHSVSQTLRTVVLPAVTDPWARLALIRLIGLAEYAPARGPDPSATRIEAIRAVLIDLVARYPELEDRHSGRLVTANSTEILEMAGRLLCASVGKHTDMAVSVRRDLKALLLRQLDEDLQASEPLFKAFRGKLNER